jgi:hypothetical protein
MDLSILTTTSWHENKGLKGKLQRRPPLRDEAKEDKVVTHRLQSYFLERAAILRAAGVSKIEATEETLSASEVKIFFFLVLNRRIFNLMLLLEFLNR